MTDAFVARERPPRWRQLAVWGMCAYIWFLAAQSFGLLAPLGIDPPAGVDQAGRILAALMAIAMVGVAIWMWRRPGKVRIRIDDHGIALHAFGSRTVSWDEVERIAHRPLGKVLRAGLQATGESLEPGFGPMAVWLKPHARSGLQAAGNRAIGYGDLNLGAAESDRTDAELVAAIKRFAPPTVPVTEHSAKDDAAPQP